ncbi:hypothetical protein BS623_00320 [Vibrio parahaemolyticus]|nr:hypothetical protein BS623_00320 [Vibrio parahaemolyticus]
MNNFSFDATIDFVVILLENITILDKRDNCVVSLSMVCYENERINAVGRGHYVKLKWRFNDH